MPANVNDIMTLVTVGVAALLAGGFLGWLFNNRFGAKSVEAMKKRVDEGVRGGRRQAEKIKRKAVLDAKEEALKERNQADREIRTRKNEVSKRERELKSGRKELQDRETKLKSKSAASEERDTELGARSVALDQRDNELDLTREEINERLERVSGLSREEAMRQLRENLRAEARLDGARMIKDIKDDAHRNADTEATKILALAVERAASEFSAERTISMFDLPKGSELKGRIIGQEGKNIRAFEQATGIQLLIDEENNSVTLSGYHPIKREIARRVLETLVKDGNIHPRRIEELTKRNTKKLDEEMRKAGQEVVREMKLKTIHPEMVKLLGRLKFRSSYGQNVLLHSKEVAYLTGMLAAELRLDEKLARRAGLLHDIGKAIDYEREGTHPEIGAEVGKKYGEHEVVVNAIASHHEDCEMTSPISVLVSAADSLSGARPGARRKTVAEYIKRIEKLEEMANSMHGVDQSYALQAGREIRVIARSKQVDDAKVDLLAADIASKIESEMDYPGKIKVTVIREVRASDTAH